jgi:hypothetical protein
MSTYLIVGNWGGLVHILMHVLKHVHLLTHTQTGTITCICMLDHIVLAVTDIYVQYKKLIITPLTSGGKNFN